MDERKQITRRAFVRSAALGAAAVAGIGGAAPLFAAGSAQLPEKWDQEADVVVIGAGGAGLAAAIEAVDAGATVLILEKSKSAGGTTAMSGGVIQASGTRFQKDAGVTDDSVENHYNYWLQAGEGIGDPALLKILAEQAPKSIDWLVEQGINYVSVYGVDPIPYISSELMQPRIHVPAGEGDAAKPGTGRVHTMALAAVAKKKGIKTLYETPATELLTDGDRGVIGVLAESDGQKLAVKANRGVVLATSSFDHNVEMARCFSPQQLWALETGACLCAKESTGDGIRMAMAIGADLAGMGGTIGYTATSIGIAAADPIPGIWVNKYGQRFVNESGHYAYVMRAVFNQEEHVAWAMFDEATKQLGGQKLGGLFGNWSDDLAQEIKDSKVFKGETVKALAEAIGANPTQLEATVAAWNKDAAAGKDTLFNRQLGVKALAKGPFYATRVYEANLGSMGGVKINEQAQVIDVNGNPIPRLYAGGMVAGGILGPYYPGSGTAVQITATFGRIAGKGAAAEKPWS